jgi:hypothetical protein
LNYFNFFTEIEDTFIRRRGKHLLLSPIDWALIEGWQNRGIPLHVVLRSIESVFDVWERNPGPRTIKGLMFCREEIEAQYQEWLSSQVGKNESGDEEKAEAFSAESIREHIQAAIEQLGRCAEPELREDVDRVINRLMEVKEQPGGDPETIDRTLLDIERFLDEALLSKTDPAHLKEVEKDVATQLKQYKAEMKETEYKSTYRLMVLKRLREEKGLPRLGLFYI